MKVVVTYLELNSPWRFFVLANYSRKIIQQLRKTNCVKYKSRGFWTKHYTMSLWNTEEEMKTFAREGAHKIAMQSSRKVAREIRIHAYDADALPDWKTAKSQLMKEGKVYRFE
ncbi:MAG: DUF3291 domain-containing protein [Bacteroidota bacterium]